MKELLIIAVGAAVVNNVVLSQFLGLCPFFGVSKKIETAAGMGGAVIFVITLSSLVTKSLIYQFVLSPFGYGLYADDSIYFSYCGVSSVCRNVFEKGNAGAVSEPWCLPSSDYYKLCGFRCCSYQCAEIL